MCVLGLCALYELIGPQSCILDLPWFLALIQNG